MGRLLQTATYGTIAGVIRSDDWPQLLLVDGRQDAINTLRHVKRCGALALLDDVSGPTGE
jgi:hypothetical protein